MLSILLSVVFACLFPLCRLCGLNRISIPYHASAVKAMHLVLYLFIHYPVFGGMVGGEVRRQIRLQQGEYGVWFEEMTLLADGRLWIGETFA